MFDWVHFQYPARIFLEKGSTHKIGSVVKDLGSRVLLLVLKNEEYNPDELAIIKTSLERYTSGCIIYDDLEKRPGFDELDTAAHFIKQSRADLILAYGGRDTFHTARAVALLATNEVFAKELPERREPLKRPPMPVITVPGVFTMGEESSPTFVMYDHATGELYHGNDPRLFPAAVFMDPAITMSMSEAEITRTGVAILAAAVEAILSKRANDLSNSMALRAIELIMRSLQNLVKDTTNQNARNNISVANLLCGVSHSNSWLGLCYSIATATNLITGMDFMMAMAILLPHVMEYNLTTSAGKYVQIARALEEDIHDITVIEAAIKAVEGVRKLYLDLKIPQRLSDFEVDKALLPEIAGMASTFPLIKNTPRELDQNEIETILIAAY
ncbi:MAG: alcohol dehydrogenase [Leptospiraceae bacterium]|nr:alcohol dehydrogenase [Leptospiraceae bacterium]